ncbi:MAG: hypothetical protein Q7J48_05530, partial [Nocardioides sp.]|nr:hypothetical protein [Nocardioides sp.]
MTDDSVWSYRPGDWLAIFGVATTLLLPGSEKARAAQLWDLVDGGAGFDETLDRVLAPGLSVLPAFVLIGTGEGLTKVIVRGAGVRATLTTETETVELDGSTVTTWVERTLDRVTALSVEVGDGIDGPDHLIRGGLVRVARIDLPPFSPPFSPPVEEDAVADVVAVDTDGSDNDGSDSLDLPEVPPDPGPVWDDDGGPVLPPLPPLPPPPPPPVPPVPPVPGALDDLLG